MPFASLSELLARHNYSHFCCGSLPFKDPNLALDFIFKRPWIIPFWPELPGISAAELMVNRAARLLRESWNGYAPSEALGLYSMRHYLDLHAYRLPLLKCQVSGPLTLVEHSSELSEDWDDSLQIATDICLEQIRWQINFFEGAAQRLLFVIDEPSLARWNQLDERRQSRVVDAFSSIYVEISERRCFLGVHSCSAFDRSVLSLPIELYSFDAVSAGKAGVQTNLPQDSARRGVVFAPGVFPACAEAGAFDAEVLRGISAAHSFEKDYKCTCPGTL